MALFFRKNREEVAAAMAMLLLLLAPVSLAALPTVNRQSVYLGWNEIQETSRTQLVLGETAVQSDTVVKSETVVKSDTVIKSDTFIKTGTIIKPDTTLEGKSEASVRGGEGDSALVIGGVLREDAIGLGTAPRSRMVVPAGQDTIRLKPLRIILAVVHFSYDQSLLNQKARRKIRTVVDSLAKDQQLFIDLEGHSDSRGTVNYNQRLSERRTRAVQAFMISLGVTIDRVTEKSFGERDPIASNQTEEGRAQNRRVELIGRKN